MIAFDVLGLVQVFEDKWEQINGKTGITTDELEQAAGLANDLVTAVGRRDQAAAPTKEESLLRQQAYTVLVRAYNDVRDGLTYLRRKEGDVDSIAPSLWAGRGKRPTEQASAPTPVTAPEAAFEVDNTSPVNDIPVGFPGSSPLMKQ